MIYDYTHLNFIFFPRIMFLYTNIHISRWKIKKYFKNFFSSIFDLGRSIELSTGQPTGHLTDMHKCAYEDFGRPLHASAVRPWFLFWSVDLTADRCCPTVVVNRRSIAEPSLAIFDPMTILLKFGLAFNHQWLIFSLIHWPYIYVTTIGNY